MRPPTTGEGKAIAAYRLLFPARKLEGLLRSRPPRQAKPNIRSIVYAPTRIHGLVEKAFAPCAHGVRSLPQLPTGQCSQTFLP